MIFNLDKDAQTGTNTDNIIEIKKEHDELEVVVDGIKTKTDYLTVTGAIDLDVVKTKTDFITVTEPVDLDKVAQYTEIMSTGIFVDNATTKPSANLTFTDSVNDFDKLELHIQPVGAGGEVEIIPLGIDITHTQVLSVGKTLTTGDNEELMFKFEITTSTTGTAWYSRIITYATYSNAQHTASTIKIAKVFGIKYT